MSSIKLDVDTVNKNNAIEDKIDMKNEITELLDEIALRVLRILELRKEQNESINKAQLCTPISFSIKKFNSERSEQW